MTDESKTKLFFPHVAEDSEGRSHYGYGWTISTSKRDTRVIAHNGGNPYFFSDFKRYVDEDVVIIFATNDWGKDNFKAYRALRQAVFVTEESAN